MKKNIMYAIAQMVGFMTTLCASYCNHTRNMVAPWNVGKDITGTITIEIVVTAVLAVAVAMIIHCVFTGKEA